MTDEEKKAIEKIKSFNQYNWEMNNLKEKEFAKPYFDALDTILNLIEKQSKEIEELKEKNRQEKMRIVQLENEITARIEDVNKYFTPNDKIEEVKDGTFDAKIVLQSLLEKEKILNRLFQKNN